MKTAGKQAGKHEKQTEKQNEPSTAAGILKIVSYLALLAVALMAGWRVFLYEPDSWTEMFAAGTSNEVPVFIMEKEGLSEETAVEAGRLIRGTTVEKLDGSEMEIGDAVYVIIDSTTEYAPADEEAERAEKACLYMREEDLAASVAETVKETEVYVRTPVTIYAEETGPAIASFAGKGRCLEVTGFDRLGPDGTVNKYKVIYADGDEDAEAPKEGYVYSKYLTDTQEKADAKFNDNGIYDKVKKDKYGKDLHGGKASHLDYYPYEKPVIEGNELCRDARAMYLNCASAVKPGSYIKLIEKTDCNAVVVDIKDGVLAYKSETAKELSPRSYKTAYASAEDYKKGIDALRETGVYLIGRIVVFNDPLYAKDHPDDCIKYGGSTDWPSAYSRNVWEYNVRLAQEAIKEFGFNEIQFDYVRFPEDAYTMSATPGTKWRNKYDEEKGQAIQNFCFYAADQIHEAGAYFSVDVFGESVYGYMTAYGQYWPGISNIVDAISAMPYTDHTGGPGAWTDPYRTMLNWGKRAKKQQKYLDDPAVARTWITGYNTPYWAPTENYGEKELKAQIKGLKDAGLKGGFIPWNAVNSLEKYKQYKNIWNE